MTLLCTGLKYEANWHNSSCASSTEGECPAPEKRNGRLQLPVTATLLATSSLSLILIFHLSNFLLSGTISRFSHALELKLSP